MDHDRCPAIDRVRHPEKAHRPDSPVQRKPDWIRVKAPVAASITRRAR